MEPKEWRPPHNSGPHAQGLIMMNGIPLTMNLVSRPSTASPVRMQFAFAIPQEILSDEAREEGAVYILPGSKFRWELN